MADCNESFSWQSRHYQPALVGGLGEALERVLFQISFGYGESITDRRSCYFGISRQDRASENKRTSVSTRIGNR